MKKLSPPPTTDMPEVYQTTPTLPQPQMQRQVSQAQVSLEMPATTPHELPKSHLYKRMKQLSSFKKIKRSYKLEAQKEQFVSDLKELFKHLPADQHKFDTELLLELLNASEEYFIYGSKEERTQSKQEVVRELMMPLFESEKILDSFVHTLSSRVKKSNLVKRILKRVWNFFC